MAIEDWIPDFDDDWLSDEAEVRCKFCGQRDLWWVQHHGKWRLENAEGELHQCPAKQAKAEEFPDYDT